MYSTTRSICNAAFPVHGESAMYRPCTSSARCTRTCSALRACRRQWIFGAQQDLKIRVGDRPCSADAFLATEEVGLIRSRGRLRHYSLPYPWTGWSYHAAAGDHRVCLTLLIYNRATTTGDVDNFRQVSEVLALTFSALAWSIPWVGGRLEEAARRQVSAKPSTRQPGSIQTLAIKSDLASDVQVDISWISSVLLRLTNADGLVIWHDGQTICSRGILKRLQGFASGAEFVLRGLDQAAAAGKLSMSQFWGQLRQ